MGFGRNNEGEQDEIAGRRGHQQKRCNRVGRDETPEIIERGQIEQNEQSQGIDGGEPRYAGGPPQPVQRQRVGRELRQIRQRDRGQRRKRELQRPGAGVEPRRIAPERRAKSGERIEYGQIEPMAPLERILEIPSGECTVDVGVEPIAQSPSDQHAHEDDDRTGPRQAQKAIRWKPLHQSNEHTLYELLARFRNLNNSFLL